MDARLTLRTEAAAATTLEGVLPAPSYTAAAALEATSARAPILKAADANAEQASELLFGERFEVLERSGAFLFGQAVRDGYVGWVDEEGLGDPGPEPTHRIAATATLAFLEPSIKAPVTHRLFLNALVVVEAREGRFAKLHGSGWVVDRHLAPIGLFAADAAGVAELFLHVPYLWGGRSADGLDCSGLVQQALYAVGKACPRDSDQQETIGTSLDDDGGRPDLRRGDLVFWRGHVGLMVDEVRLIHANAHAMAVSVEPLAEAIDRIRASGVEPTAFRRV